ncbi:MAG: CHRD domain-containing protein, partial [Chitinophagaceae bacterium]
RMKFFSGRKTLAVAGMAFFSVMALGITGCDKDNDDERVYTISGNASGSQVVPAVIGNGTGTITGTYDPNNRMLTYTTSWSNLSSAPTSARFYNGNSGTSGTPTGNPWTLGSGLTGAGNYSGTMTLTSDEETQLTRGKWYYSYSTTGNPNGEVRGQVTATQQ